MHHFPTVIVHAFPGMHPKEEGGEAELQPSKKLGLKNRFSRQNDVKRDLYNLLFSRNQPLKSAK
jgi:hypothetical protein